MYEYAIKELAITKNYIMDFYKNSKMPKDMKAKIKDFEKAIEVLELLEGDNFDYSIDLLDSHRGEMSDLPLMEKELDRAIKILSKK